VGAMYLLTLSQECCSSQKQFADSEGLAFILCPSHTSHCHTSQRRGWRGMLSFSQE
jgi:hypothetical protein